MSASDDKLLEGAVAGDRQSLSELLRRHGPAARRSLAGRIDPRWQSLISSDDIMQETYAEAFLGIGRFRPEGESAFARWLTKLARNNLLDAIKSLRRAKRGGDLERVGNQPPESDESYFDLAGQLGFTTSTPSRKAALKEAKAALDESLEQLPEAYRLVVSLYDLAGCSAQDTAEACGCSVGAMYLRRSRAHAMLRERLGSSVFPAR